VSWSVNVIAVGPRAGYLARYVASTAMTRIAILMTLLIPLVGCAETAPSSANANNSPPPISSPSESTDTTPAPKKPPQQETVVTLTDAAVAKVREVQKQNGKPYLRVAVKSGGSTGFMYDLQFDDQLNADEDYLDESHGLKIVVDRKSALYIDGTSIDWQVTDDGREGFHFDNPNAVQE